jgi:hypothetical protein
MRILILIAIFWCGKALGQPGFNLPFDFGRIGANFSNIILNKDTILLHGTAFTEDSPYKTGLLITWADTNGNILKTRFHLDSLGKNFLYFYGNPFIRLKDGSGYLIFVHVRKNGALMKVNPNGDVVSLTEYVDNTSITDFYRQIIEVDDGFYVAGYKQRLDYLMDGFVMKLDKNGKKRWEKYYDSSGRNTGIGSFLILSPNEFALTTGSSPNNTQVPINQRSYTNEFFITDSLMNIKKQWKSPMGLEFSSQGLKNLSGQKWGHLSSDILLFPEDDNWTRQTKYIVRDKDFNKVNEVKLGTGSSRVNVLYNLNLCPDGNYVAAGEMFVGGNRPTQAGWLYKMTPEGDSIWSVLDTLFYIEGGYVEHYLTGTVVLPSGSVIACGIVDAYKGNAGKSWAWLLKVSKDGCIEASNCVPVSDLENPENKDGFMVYPNPAGTFVYFNDPARTQWEAVEIMDLSGKTVLRMDAPSANQMDVGALTNGIYFVKFLKSNKYKIKKINIIK